MCWKLATHCWRRGGRWSAKLSTTGCSRRTPRLPFSLGYGCHRETKLTTINGVLLYFSYFLQQSLGKRNYRIMWEINQVKPMFAQSETGRQHQALALSGSTIFFTKKSTQSQFSYSSGHIQILWFDSGFISELHTIFAVAVLNKTKKNCFPFKTHWLLSLANVMIFPAFFPLYRWCFSIKL